MKVTTIIGYILTGMLNILTTIWIMIAIFNESAQNFISDREFIFMIWLNILSHITLRTRRIQKD